MNLSFESELDNESLDLIERAGLQESNSSNLGPFNMKTEKRVHHSEYIYYMKVKICICISVPLMLPLFLL